MFAAEDNFPDFGFFSVFTVSLYICEPESSARTAFRIVSKRVFMIEHSAWVPFLPSQNLLS